MQTEYVEGLYRLGQAIAQEKPCREAAFFDANEIPAMLYSGHCDHRLFWRDDANSAFAWHQGVREPQ
jgi:hypothetical protein